MAYQKTIVFTTIGKHPSVIDTIQMANIAEDYGDGTPRKRKRLTHLSPDEKLMRRKLKNRVAAQTARDRKKVLMQDLEEKVAKLEEEKKLLMKENTVLHKSTNNLKLENQYLKKQLSALATTTTTTTTVSPAAIPSGQLTCQVESTDAAQSASPCKTEPVSPGSAAPAVSLPKEQIQHDSLLHFLEEFSQEIGGVKPEAETTSTSSPAFDGFGELEFVDGETGATGSMVGTAATDVGSINELIMSEHHYYKVEEPSVLAASNNNLIVSSSDSLVSPVVLTTDGLGAELALTSSVPPNTTQVVVISRPAPTFTKPATTFLPAVAKPAVTPTAVMATSANQYSSYSRRMANRAALTRMVNPNEVCAPRLARADSKTEDVDTLLQDLLDAEMVKELEQNVESLLSDEEIKQFLQPLSQDQAPAQQQNVVTSFPVPTTTGVGIPSATPATTTTNVSNSRKRKQSCAQSPPTITFSAPSPPVHVPDGFGYDMTLIDDGHSSPDSGCYGTDSDVSSPHSSDALSPRMEDDGLNHDSEHFLFDSEWSTNFMDFGLPLD